MLRPANDTNLSPSTPVVVAVVMMVVMATGVAPVVATARVIGRDDASGQSDANAERKRRGQQSGCDFADHGLPPFKDELRNGVLSQKESVPRHLRRRAAWHGGAAVNQPAGMTAMTRCAMRRGAIDGSIPTFAISGNGS